jgi:hypothetical protein
LSGFVSAWTARSAETEYWRRSASNPVRCGLAMIMELRVTLSWATERSRSPGSARRVAATKTITTSVPATGSSTRSRFTQRLCRRAATNARCRRCRSGDPDERSIGGASASRQLSARTMAERGMSASSVGREMSARLHARSLQNARPQVCRSTGQPSAAALRNGQKCPPRPNLKGRAPHGREKCEAGLRQIKPALAT